MSELRDYQKRVIDEIYATWRLGKRAILLAMPTGSGKTLTSFKAAQIHTALPKVHKVLFVVDRADLDYQTSK